MKNSIFLTVLLGLFLVSTAIADPGDTLWTRTYGGSFPDVGKCVQQTSDGGYILAGWTMSFGAGNYDFWLLKTNANGDTLWTRTYGGESYDYGYSVQQTTDGGYIIAGYTKSFGAGNYDFWLLKTDANGDTLWTRTYGGSEIDYSHSVQQTADGGYIITGYTKSFGAGSYDVWLLKLAGDVVGVDGPVFETSLPASASLSRCYPNPFNVGTVIEYQVPEASEVRLEVYNILGEKVATLVNSQQQAGYRSVTWEDSEAASGIYFYKLSAGDYTETRRMMLVK